jgi:hypothetical protein
VTRCIRHARAAPAREVAPGANPPGRAMPHSVGFSKSREKRADCGCAARAKCRAKAKKKSGEGGSGEVGIMRAVRLCLGFTSFPLCPACPRASRCPFKFESNGAGKSTKLTLPSLIHFRTHSHSASFSQGAKLGMHRWATRKGKSRMSDYFQRGNASLTLLVQQLSFTRSKPLACSVNDMRTSSGEETGPLPSTRL